MHKKKSHFIFDGQYYDQIDGVATGSPVLICHSEEKSALSNNTRPSIWFRYADDTFILFDNNNATNQILHYLNSCRANINNTMISFLNILIKRSNRAFSTPIYRKTTQCITDLIYIRKQISNLSVGCVVSGRNHVKLPEQIYRICLSCCRSLHCKRVYLRNHSRVLFFFSFFFHSWSYSARFFRALPRLLDLRCVASSIFKICLNWMSVL